MRRNERPKLSRSGVIILTILAVPTVLALGAQGPQKKHRPLRNPPQPIYSTTETLPLAPQPSGYISTHFAPAIVDRTGDFVQVAQCSPGEQLLGGGYFSSDSEPYVYYVSVKANYPSSDSTWTVIFHNPQAPETKSSSQLKAPFNNIFVVAYAYCLNAPGYPLDLVTVNKDNSDQPKQEIIDTTPGAIASGGLYQGVPQSWTVSCPTGGVLTGGGFAVDGPDQDTDAIQNTDITASIPTVADDGIAKGWRVSLVAYHTNTLRTVRAYARCSQRGLTPLPATTLAVDITSGYASGEHELNAQCAGSGISTAGGYALHGDWLTPHPVFFTRATSDYRIWQVMAFGAYQTTDYPDARPCNPQTTQCLVGAINASCFAPPEIPFISVRIISPPDGYNFPQDPTGGNVTEPIVLTAEVFDRNGSLIPDATVSWSYASAQPVTASVRLSSGNPLVARLPAGESISWLWIQANARVNIGAGKNKVVLTARDSIQVTTGTVK